MLDMSWSEILVIAVVALVVIGPKDLPKVIREVGKWTGKARSMAREFQRSFDDMVRESELDEIRQQLDQVRPGNLKNTIRDAVDPDGDLKRSLDLHDDGTPRQPDQVSAIDAPDHVPSSPAPELQAPALHDHLAHEPHYDEPANPPSRQPAMPVAGEQESAEKVKQS